MTNLPSQTPIYISSIPIDAVEKIIARFSAGEKEIVHYYRGDEWVGSRQFLVDGTLIDETSYENGFKNGWQYEFDDKGVMLFRERCVDGVPNGIVSQWTHDGDWIGSYEIIDGNGWEFWWQENESDEIYLEEAFPLKDGHWHGISWHINDDQKTVHQECYWYQGRLHGIERYWRHHGGLYRGYPRYYVHGERVTKREYLRARKNDATIPEWRSEDDQPERTFPEEVQRYIRDPQYRKRWTRTNE